MIQNLCENKRNTIPNKIQEAAFICIISNIEPLTTVCITPMIIKVKYNMSSCS